MLGEGRSLAIAKLRPLAWASLAKKEEERPMENWPEAWELVLPIRPNIPGLLTYLRNIKPSAKLEWTTPKQGLAIIQDGCSLPGLLSRACSSPREL